MLRRQVCELHERGAPSLSFDGLSKLHCRRIVWRAIRQSSGNRCREVASGQPRIDSDPGRAAQPIASAQFAERVPRHSGNGVAQPRVAESGEAPAGIFCQLLARKNRVKMLKRRGAFGRGPLHGPLDHRIPHCFINAPVPASGTQVCHRSVQTIDQPQLAYAIRF
jgi:hypothetical protein